MKSQSSFEVEIREFGNLERRTSNVDLLRYRVSRLADFQLELQEHLHEVPAARVPEYLQTMEENAVELSALATILIEREREAAH